MPSWRRPAGPINIWRIVEAEEKLENGSSRLLKFSIQELPEDRRQEALDFMVRYFIPDEPICESLNVKDDSEKIHDFFLIWNYCLDQGIVEVAYIGDSNNQMGELAAVNMLCVFTEDTYKELHQLTDKFQSPKMIKYLDMIINISKKADARTILGVDKYMSAFGLAVASHLRGKKLGLQMLEARSEIGRKYGIPVSSTPFSAKVSQMLAKRAGYKEEASQNYDEVFDDNKLPLFPNIKTKDVKIMMKRLF